MKKLPLFLMLAIGSAMAAKATSPGDNQVVILGEVLNDEGKALVGSKIFVTNVCTNVTTEITAGSSKGEFQFTGEFCGTYILEAKAEGYKNSGKVLEIGADKTQLVTLKMVAEKAGNKPDKKIRVESRSL